MFGKAMQVDKRDCEFYIYQHCLMTKSSPNVVVDEYKIKEVFKKSSAWLVRFITIFDIDEATDWWYCIKDDDYDLATLKAKQRYEINKGRKNFFVKIINPYDYDESIYTVDEKKFQEYPKSYRPTVKMSGNKYLTADRVENGSVWFGLFDLKDGNLCGYAVVKEIDYNCVNLDVVAIFPETFKRNSSAALVDGILTYYKEKPERYFICDGSRNVRHITNYQDFLCSTFGFRKAYCRLKIIYKLWMKIALLAMRPFKNLLLKSNIPVLYNIGSILRMDEYAKSSQRSK